MRVTEKLKGLRTKLDQEIAAARQLLDGAKKEKRSLSSDEESKYASCLNAARQLKLDIENLPTRDAPEPDIGDGAPAPAPVLLRTAEGREVRSLAPADRLADLPEVRASLPEGMKPEELDFGRLLRGMVTGEWRDAQAEKRAMSISDAALGGFLVPDILSSQIIDKARNQARVIQAGARTIPMTSSTLALAKVVTDPVPAWKAEGAEAGFTEGTLGSVKLVAKTLIGVTSASVELFEDAVNAGDLVGDLLASALTLELDRAALLGDGSAIEPTGVRNHLGIQTIDMGTNGGALTSYDDFSTAVELLEIANTPNDALAVIYNPRESGALDRLKDSTNQPLRPPESWTGLRKFTTNQIPIDLTKGTSSDASDAFVGDWKQLFIGVRTSLRIEASREAGDSTSGAFKNLQVWIRAYLRADVVAVKADHFVHLDGIVPV